jgi:uncharacterized protein (TIGR02145 family)
MNKRFTILLNLLFVSLFLTTCTEHGIWVDTPPVFNLEIIIIPDNGGSANPSSGSYELGSTVKITGNPSVGYQFNAWVGDILEPSNPTTVLMDSDKTVTIVFEEINPDYDNDGILNADDLCPNTPPGVTVDDNGCDGAPTLVPTDVYNPVTGKIWMDRNLGAKHVATSSTDVSSYGHLYQWGRGTDGHQYRSSESTNIVSSTDVPGHANFIKTGNYNDWRSPQNNNLWQGVSGINNPCPTGYRIPTETEWKAEIESWSSNNVEGAFNSPLKLPAAGYRDRYDDVHNNVGSGGHYWSSTVDGIASQSLSFGPGNLVVDILGRNRANGMSCRCIKE